MNRLADETSPYLLQHAGNPVDWFPWGDAAFERAAELDRPVFLSVGYSACHWCHVMERESFESAEVAQFLNAHFVSVKVDREERPDVDAVYMDAVQALSGRGGWPMSVFLAPDRRPFYGGTYWPHPPKYGQPGFLHILGRIAHVWRARAGPGEHRRRRTDGGRRPRRGTRRPAAANRGANCWKTLASACCATRTGSTAGSAAPRSSRTRSTCGCCCGPAARRG